MSYLLLLMMLQCQGGYLYFDAVTMLIYSEAWVSLFAPGQPLENTDSELLPLDICLQT